MDCTLICLTNYIVGLPYNISCKWEVKEGINYVITNEELLYIARNWLKMRSSSKK